MVWSRVFMDHSSISPIFYQKEDNLFTILLIISCIKIKDWFWPPLLCLGIYCSWLIKGGRTNFTLSLPSINHSLYLHLVKKMSKSFFSLYFLSYNGPTLIIYQSPNYINSVLIIILPMMLSFFYFGISKPQYWILSYIIIVYTLLSWIVHLVITVTF